MKAAATFRTFGHFNNAITVNRLPQIPTIIMMTVTTAANVSSVRLNLWVGKNTENEIEFDILEANDNEIINKKMIGQCNGDEFLARYCEQIVNSLYLCNLLSIETGWKWIIPGASNSIIIRITEMDISS